MAKIKTRIGTREESLPHLSQVHPQFRLDLSRENGHPEAARVVLDAATGKPVWNQDDFARVAYPWLLSDIFSI